jgi:hypothetical protein
MSAIIQVPEVDASSAHKAPLNVWQTELLFAIPVVGLVLYLFYIWYAVSDRYFMFLYFHNMGPGFDTSPFGPVTASRYWMAGLVAAGAVTVPYVLLNVALGRLVKTFRPPVWWRVWLLCAVPLTIAIPTLVMTVNDPVLPLANALQVIVAALAGLALALAPGKIAAEQPTALTWLAVDGFGLAILLLFLPHIDQVLSGLAPRSAALMVVMAIVSLVIILVMTLYYWWRHTQAPIGRTWLVAGSIIAYLLLPLAHHLFAGGDAGSGRFAYITDSANFFAGNALMQIGVWGVLVVLALSLTRLRRRVVHPTEA